MLLSMLPGAGCHKKPPPPPPPEVRFITLSPTNVPISEEWIGTLEGFVNADIRAQVSGYLQKQAYAEGSLVGQGDLLFEIDPRPFQAALDQAEAKLAQDNARSAKTGQDVQRYTPLLRQEAVSQETLANAVQADRAAKALVQADEAAVESARLNLGFTRIKSPITGVAGTALAQIGDLVGPSGPVLTTVSTIDPIRVSLQANEQSYLTFWRHFAISSDTNRYPALDLLLSDGSRYPFRGRFFYADREVNPITGTMRIVGLFPNPDRTLRPGQYALVRVQTQVKTNILLVPQRAVTELQGGYQVAVVGDDHKVRIQPVKVGRQFDASWIADEGLDAGDRVVVEGIQKAKAGVKVNPLPLAEHGITGVATNAAR